ncbi:cytochrome c-550 PedF [Roseinatronobacter alkalisoli]|uniref:Cytochrome c-550 PedF n=1 Tax=Roseinatronobacter alkalisoli TaxID=3028235 RepID=A0ABT5T7G1_9RHOB|nr:cytochrome c-550 PedF [Roseinatronobacter sp. HJB301]MDD7971065.1 cytochrome c-550 PedF [Roseinatronobacter sp. HJB301]
MPYRLHILPPAALALALSTSLVLAHGDVAPQPVNTEGLPELTGGWELENPFRDPDGQYWERALRIGDSAYNQNCARCHGLEVVSGGLAPDLRFLMAEEMDDEWYMERLRRGSGDRMPGFEEVMNQQAMWAIRTYIETRPDPDGIAEFMPRLRDIRDGLRDKQEAIAAGTATEADFADEIAALHVELMDIAVAVPTMSGAPKADSIARRAAVILERGGERFLRDADETLTIGLSVAR